MSVKKQKALSLNIHLTAKQVKMYNMLNEGRWKEVLFYGSSRSGKTFLIVYWMIVQCVVFGANCLVLRNLFSSLQKGMLKQTLPAVLKAIAVHNGYSSIEKIKMSDGTPFCRFNGKDSYLEFYNKAYIQFSSIRGSAENDSSFDKILSTEWGHIFIDEVSEVEERAVDTLRSRLSQKMEVRGKLIFALNPTRKSGWTYVRFFKHQTRDGIAIPKDIYDEFLVAQFKLDDNKENVAEDYEKTLQSMSALQRKRYLEGEYFDESEGEVFKKIVWSDSNPTFNLPRPEQWEDIIIYTDPSPGDKKGNDYKATVLIGKYRAKYWLIDVLAVQGSTLEMVKNMKALYDVSPNKLITSVWMEKKQIPADFRTVFDMFQKQTGWICPFKFDTRPMGDKFTMIESLLEPLFSFDKFIFNANLRNTSMGELAVNQFLFFSKKINHDRKDDIPDACAKGVSLLSRETCITTSFKDKAKLIVRPKRNTF